MSTIVREIRDHFDHEWVHGPKCKLCGVYRDVSKVGCPVRLAEEIARLNAPQGALTEEEAEANLSPEGYKAGVL